MLGRILTPDMPVQGFFRPLSTKREAPLSYEQNIFHSDDGVFNGLSAGHGLHDPAGNQRRISGRLGEEVRESQAGILSALAQS